MPSDPGLAGDTITYLPAGTARGSSSSALMLLYPPVAQDRLQLMGDEGRGLGRLPRAEPS
jgi:hypothetical protein